MCYTPAMKKRLWQVGVLFFSMSYAISVVADERLPEGAISITPAFDSITRTTRQSILSSIPGYFSYDGEYFYHQGNRIFVKSGKVEPPSIGSDEKLFLTMTPSGKYALYRFSSPENSNPQGGDLRYRYALLDLSDGEKNAKEILSTYWDSNRYLAMVSSKNRDRELSFVIVHHNDLGNSKFYYYSDAEKRGTTFSLPVLKYAQGETIGGKTGSSDLSTWISSDYTYLLRLTTPRLPPDEKPLFRIVLTVFDMKAPLIGNEKRKYLEFPTGEQSPKEPKVEEDDENKPRFGWGYSPFKNGFAYFQDKEFTMIDAASLKEILRFKLPEFIHSMHFSPDGRHILGLTDEENLIVIDTTDPGNKPTKIPVSFGKSETNGKAFSILESSSDEKKIAVTYEIVGRERKYRIVFFDLETFFRTTPKGEIDFSQPKDR
jgi:hypothetical protein